MINKEASGRKKRFEFISNKYNPVSIRRRPIDIGTKNIGPRIEAVLLKRTKNKTENNADSVLNILLVIINREREIKIVRINGRILKIERYGIPSELRIARIIWNPCSKLKLVSPKYCGEFNER